MKTRLEEFLSLVEIDEFDQKYADDITAETYFGFPIGPIIEAEKKLFADSQVSVAYFSMEYGLATNFYNQLTRKAPTHERNCTFDHEIFSNMRIEDLFFEFKLENILDMPVYSGGLGVLAGDTIKTAADLGISLAGIGILWEKGYFRQKFWFKYGQSPVEMDWDPGTYPGLIPLKKKVQVQLKGQSIYLKLWKYYVFSHDRTKATVLVFLDTDTPENEEDIKRLTDQLYRSDNNWIKIMQRAILGMGGIRALEALGYHITKYHLNEGHAALAFVDKVSRQKGKESEAAKEQFVYTCHTPVVAGHDRFPLFELEKVLPAGHLEIAKKYGMDGSSAGGGIVDFTTLLMEGCAKINAVSQRHAAVTKKQFPQFSNKISTVTNGIHVPTWLSESMRELFMAYTEVFGDFYNRPQNLKNILKIKDDVQFRSRLWQAHQANKKRLEDMFHSWRIKSDVFTLGWARRIAAYKRPSLIFQDPKRLLDICKRIGPIQIIIAGKAHPNDNLVGTYINEIMNTIDALHEEFRYVRIIMLENYDTYFGQLLTSCVDVWLNNPLPPFEASGTSGMKAILNGVIQLSTVDGWIGEADFENMGEVFGYRYKESGPIGSELDLRLKEDSAALYEALERLITLYYQLYKRGEFQSSCRWIDLMIHCIKEASIFNTHRMLKDYERLVWNLDHA